MLLTKPDGAVDKTSVTTNGEDFQPPDTGTGQLQSSCTLLWGARAGSVAVYVVLVQSQGSAGRWKREASGVDGQRQGHSRSMKPAESTRVMHRSLMKISIILTKPHGLALEPLG